MKKIILLASILTTFSAISAEQVSQEQVQHFKLIKTGTVQVSQSMGSISSPSALNAKLSELADEKGAQYYRIIAAGKRGNNVMGVADIYKTEEKK